MQASTNRHQYRTATSALSLRVHTARQAVSKAVTITRNLRQHFYLSRLMGELGLLNQQDFYAGIRYRYLRTFYLGAAFSIPERLEVAINHYQNIGRHFRAGFLKTARRTGFGLWRHTHDDTRIDIALRYPYAYNHDGDLCLTLDVNGVNICIVTFSIAPGATVGVPESQVLLVSGIQGIAGKIAEIRHATEVCNNVSPAHMLLFAAETLGAEIGVKTLVGMGQGRVRGEHASRFDYDAFWMPMANAEHASDFYPLALPFADKPLEAIAAKHRSRARKRRELRNVIRSDIAGQTQAVLLKDCLITGNNITQQ
jgi:uncharacterized protein VirK/YbjX